MTKEDKTQLFENYPIPKAVMTLALPTIISCLVMVLYNLADTFFVGKLNDAVQTSAVTIAAPVLLAFNAITNLFGTGCASVMSRALGKKDIDTFRKTSSLGFYSSIISGFFFALLATVFKTPLLKLLGSDAINNKATSDYLFWTVTCGAIPSMVNVVMANLVRSEGSALNASIGTMSGCVLNIILDPIFIMPWGLNMGSSGAGCATFISNCVACLYFFIFVKIRKDKTYVSLKLNDFRVNKTIIKDVFGVGIPASIQNLLNVTGMTILNNFMASYGTEAVSAMGITHKVAMIPMYVSMGIAQGIMPLVGYNYSCKNRERMRKTIRFSESIASIFMVIATILTIVFSENIIAIFMTNEMIVSYGSAFLKGAALALPFLFIDFLAVGVFQACGKGKTSLVFAIMRKIVLEIPALFILNRIWPMYGLSYAQFVAEVILAISASIILKKLCADNI